MLNSKLREDARLSARTVSGWRRQTWRPVTADSLTRRQGGGGQGAPFNRCRKRSTNRKRLGTHRLRQAAVGEAAAGRRGGAGLVVERQRRRGGGGGGPRVTGQRRRRRAHQPLDDARAVVHLPR